MQQEWDHAKNAHYGNAVIKPQSNRSVWWKCDKCPLGHPHVWEARVFSRTEGCNCPFCSSRAVCSHNTLATLALATLPPHIALEWDYNENLLTPDDYTWKSGEQASWRCQTCDHQWAVSIHSRVRKNTFCPECYDARRGLKADGTRTSHPTLANTSHPMMAQFDYARNASEGLDPEEIKCCSHKLVLWICFDCPKRHIHRWTVSPNQRFPKGRGCPYCKHKQACVCNSLQTRCPEIASEWDYNKNAKTPHDYLASSTDEVWWITSDGTSWLQVIDRRTGAYMRRARRSAVPLIKHARIVKRP